MEIGMSNSGGDFHIELATVSDLPEILELVSSEYGPPYNGKVYWNWRYFDNPVAKVLIYVARAANGKIAAMQAVSGYSIHMNGKICSAHMLTGAMTSPHFRRRGLFRSLVQRIIQDLSNQGALMLYTFPNNLSVQGFRRFPGWKENESLSLYVRPLFGITGRGRHVDDRADRTNLGTSSLKLEIVSGQEFHVGGDELLNNSNPALSFIDRSKQYLSWRYGPASGNEYKMLHAYCNGDYVGYVVWKAIEFKGMNAGLILDIVARDNVVASELLRATVTDSKKQGIRMLAFLVGPTNPNAKALVQNGFVKWPNVLFPKHFYLFTYAFHQDTDHSIGTSSDANWYLTWGDTDVA
jgi:ribosomal protein S18 acetylase RimI-like enzyme